ARPNLPTFEPVAMRHDALPPQKRKLIRLLADGALFQLPQKWQAILQIQHAALPLIELIKHWIFVTVVVYRTLFPAQVREQIEIRLVHEFAVEIDAGIEAALTQIVEIGPAFKRRVRNIETDFAPLIDDVDAADFIGFFDVAVFKNERKSVRHAGF